MDEEVELNGSLRFPGYGGALYASLHSAFFFGLHRLKIQYQETTDPMRTAPAATDPRMIIDRGTFEFLVLLPFSCGWPLTAKKAGKN
jgi:hypothetical protein